VPEIVTDCGEPVALSVKRTEDARAPVAVGVKVTVAVQLPAGAIVVQAFTIEKSAAFPPDITTLEKVTGAELRGFAVAVIICIAAACPTTVDGKVSVEGDTAIEFVGGACPVPVSGTACGDAGASSVKISWHLEPQQRRA